MDRLVDEAEGLAVESSSSVASGGGGGGGRMEQATDQQLSLLNSITASDLTGEWTPTPPPTTLGPQAGLVRASGALFGLWRWMD